MELLLKLLPHGLEVSIHAYDCIMYIEAFTPLSTIECSNILLELCK